MVSREPVKKYVMWVDDDIDCCGATVILLERLGYSVFTYPNEADATRDIQNGVRYDTILVDLDLSTGGSGTGVMRTSKRVNPSAKVICLTGYYLRKAEYADMTMTKKELADILQKSPEMLPF